MIITTIQKMANALRNKRYTDIMDTYKTKKCIFIIDECHRSQFGKMHADIKSTSRMQTTSDSLELLSSKRTKELLDGQQPMYSIQVTKWMRVSINT